MRINLRDFLHLVKDQASKTIMYACFAAVFLRATEALERLNYEQIVDDEEYETANA